MPRYTFFGRHEYAEPLELIGSFETDGVPTVRDAGVGDDWLELVAVPEDDAIWVIRDGSLVEERRGVPA
jgi:hypothetical protein